MIIHKCDRCGSEITGIPHTISYPDKHGIERESVELCNDCFDSFKEWLNAFWNEFSLLVKDENSLPMEFAERMKNEHDGNM